MAGIKDLKLGKDVAITDGDWGKVPEQIGSRKAPLQPGPYRFQLPSAAAIGECFDVMEVEIDGKAATRVVAILRDAAALTVIQAPARYADRVGESWGTRISNVERRRGKGDDAPTASDMDYVLQALAPKDPRPKTNREYLTQFEKVAPGREIGGEIEWNWRCDPKKHIRVPEEPENPDNRKTEALDGEDGREVRMGCGTKYYQRDVPKVDKDGNEDAAHGEYPRTVDCTCGAVLFCNENLGNFRA